MRIDIYVFNDVWYISRVGTQQLIFKTSSGQQIQLNRQAQLQLLQQQRISGNTTLSQLIDGQSGGVAQQTPAVIGRSITPGGTSINIPFSTQVTQQTLSQLKSASPAPNVNLVHLPPNIQQQQQQQSQQQFQIGPGTILQIPSAGGSAAQTLTNTTLIQGQVPTQTALFGNSQSTLVNTNNTLIQNPNIVNVNVAQQQPIVPQQRSNLGGINIQGK